MNKYHLFSLSPRVVIQSLFLPPLRCLQVLLGLIGCFVCLLKLINHLVCCCCYCWFYCLFRKLTLLKETSNAAIFSVASNGQTKTISACFEEEITYMFCSLRILRDTPIHFSFSTVAPVIRKKMTEIPDASLAYMDGIQSGWGANFGFEKFVRYPLSFFPLFLLFLFFPLLTPPSRHALIIILLVLTGLSPPLTTLSFFSLPLLLLF